MWPPNHTLPGSEQFREYVWNINFEDGPDADDMFAEPTPVPGFENYPETEDKSVHSTHNSDSENSSDVDSLLAQFTQIPDLKDGPDAYEILAHPAPVSRPVSPPLPPLRPGDLPPLRGTGLGKTTVRPPPREVERVNTGSSKNLGASSSEMDPPHRSRLCNMGPASTESGKKIEWSSSNMGPPLEAKPRGVETLGAAIEPRINMSASVAEPSLGPKTHDILFNAAGITVTVTSNMGPAPKSTPRKLEFGSNGHATTHASFSDTGRPQKRQRLQEDSTPSKRHCGHGDASRLTVIVDHRYDEETQPEAIMRAQRVEELHHSEELHQPGQGAMLTPLAEGAHVCSSNTNTERLIRSGERHGPIEELPGASSPRRDSSQPLLNPIFLRSIPEDYKNKRVWV